MTGKSPRKKVDALYWQGRSRAAQACLDAAQQAYLLAEPGQNCNPVISQIVSSAMAFGDSLTARRAQVVNQQDHARAPRLLRDVLGNLLPEGQERRYRRILSFKDEVRYGTRQASRDDAGRLLADLGEFTRWAQELLQRRSRCAARRAGDPRRRECRDTPPASSSSASSFVAPRSLSVPFSSRLSVLRVTPASDASSACE